MLPYHADQNDVKLEWLKNENQLPQACSSLILRDVRSNSYQRKNGS